MEMKYSSTSHRDTATDYQVQVHINEHLAAGWSIAHYSTCAAVEVRGGDMGGRIALSPLSATVPYGVEPRPSRLSNPDHSTEFR
jgi:hypothetical protein